MAKIKYKDGSTWKEAGSIGKHKQYWVGGDVSITNNTTGTPTASANLGYMDVMESEGDTFWSSTQPYAYFTFSNLRGATGSPGGTGSQGVNANCVAMKQIWYNGARTIYNSTSDVWNSTSMRLAMTQLKSSWYASDVQYANYVPSHNTSYGYLYSNSYFSTYSVSGAVVMYNCTVQSQDSSSGGTSNQGLKAGIAYGSTTGSLTGILDGMQWPAIYPSVNYINTFYFPDYLISGAAK